MPSNPPPLKNPSSNTILLVCNINAKAGLAATYLQPTYMEGKNVKSRAFSWARDGSLLFCIR
ncbi:MAG TPA: hypothetical protein PLM20_04595 [Syntrophomonadaceae bacterium]|nr:hypothetical protein [Syntrophomonadaceae bacterium]